MSMPERAFRAPAPELLLRQSPSPEEILARLPVSRRTHNSLRRFVAQGGTTGVWSFGRLLEIPGFGRRALEDVMGALGGRPSDVPVAPAASGRLDEEIDHVLSVRPGRRESMATPALDKAIALIAARLPASEEDISRRLRAAALCRRPVDLGQIERASRYCDVPPPFAVLRREGLVLAVPVERLAIASSLYALATRAVVNWGLALVRRIGFQARTEDLDFVTAVLAAKQSFRWLDRRQGWFWFETEQSRLVRTIQKILSVRNPVNLRDLALVLFRRWPPDNSPSPKALRTLCSQVPGLVVEGRVVRSRTAPTTRGLSDRERTLVEVFETCGPRIEGHRLHEICERLGVASSLLGRTLRGSPLVVEPQPGVFRLIGT